jgi:hypothetical protein
MSIIVSVKIHDGIVVPAESATTFTGSDTKRPLKSALERR